MRDDRRVGDGSVVEQLTEVEIFHFHFTIFTFRLKGKGTLQSGVCNSAFRTIETSNKQLILKTEPIDSDQDREIYLFI